MGKQVQRAHSEEGELNGAQEPCQGVVAWI